MTRKLEAIKQDLIQTFATHLNAETVYPGAKIIASGEEVTKEGALVLFSKALRTQRIFQSTSSVHGLWSYSANFGQFLKRAESGAYRTRSGAIID